MGFDSEFANIFIRSKRHYLVENSFLLIPFLSRILVSNSKSDKYFDIKLAPVEFKLISFINVISAFNYLNSLHISKLTSHNSIIICIHMY